MRERLRDARLWVLIAAAVLTCLAIVLPRVKLTREVYDLVAVVDITASMNTRDMTVGGQTVSRIDAAKDTLGRLLADLPCQSRLGLGIFTERRSFLLFNPAEVCENFAPLETAIHELDWRMAWEGDSMVAKGFFHAATIAEDLKADLLFLTDGQEAPPLPAGGTMLPDFEGTPGKVKGLLIGVGGREKVPLAKFDDEGHEVGTYAADEVPQENRTGPPPPDAHLRPGYHPKWAPFGTDPPSGDEHLTSVRTEYLDTVAARIGFGRADLVDQPNLLEEIASHARPRPVAVAVDVRPVPAALALALLVGLYAAPLFARIRTPVRRTHPSAPPVTAAALRT
ncbi:vWA domain-containing protein [Hyphomicrobium sp. CS1GBMeth3]|uniref:vWA domain-containing protein n=1 Tax=Hyphomicrobium sp. CS1GBMeth3 TaxID=1892845 RepID=UPI0009308CDF|nr:vWA domain-containing protein [Hyphomicrobium sp. CS1GBMeth3]